MQENEINKRLNTFLRSDLDDYLAFSGLHYQDLLKMNTHPNQSKAINNMLPKDIEYAEKVTRCVGLAICSCTNSKNKPFQKIIVKYYFERYSNSEVMHDLNCSEYRYKQLKRQAVSCFANYFIYFQLIEHVKPLIELTV